MDLAGGAAVVTGATEGIGRSIAFALGRAGARVAICARSDAKVAATVERLRGAGIDAVGRACDVANPDAVGAFAHYVTERHGAPRVLVNNAGVAHFKPLDALSLAEWDETIGTNVRSLYLVTRAFLGAMQGAGGGTIVNIASLAGKNGIEGGTAYCASKHAVLGFSKALMLEVRRHQVRVVAICPGSVDTSFGGRAERARANRDQVLQPDDVAHAVLATLTAADRAMVSELDIRPTSP